MSRLPEVSMGSAMIKEYTSFVKEQVKPLREQLVNQLISGSSGDEKTEFVRGQIKGLDRALSAIDDASRKFTPEAD